MKKQSPPSSQSNRPQSNAQKDVQSSAPQKAPTQGANQSAIPQSPSSSSIGGLVKRNSIIRRFSQRKGTKMQQDEQLRPNWKTLSTGLEMLFSEEQVQKIWQFDKPKMIIAELLNDLLKRLDAHKNFESMELNIIAEFHLYNLIYAKQTLFLDNYKSAVFLNLMWTLLINDNMDYRILHTNYTKATIQSIDDLNRKNSIQNLAVKNTQQTQPTSSKNLGAKTGSLQNISDSLKNISGDLQNFKKWILKHSIHEPPSSLKIFDSRQVQMIAEFAQNSYFSNFSLYNYCLNNKKKNEEIHIQLFVDKPCDIPPLSDALYMGQPKIEIPEDEDDDHQQKLNLKQKKQSNQGTKQRVPSSQLTQIDKLSNKNSLQGGVSIEKAESEISRQKGEEDQDENYDDQDYDDQEQEGDDENVFDSLAQKHSSQSNRSKKKIDPEEQEIRTIVHNKLKSIEEQFSQTLQKRQEDLDRQYDEIVNPKKKK